MFDLYFLILLKFCLKDGKEGEEKVRDEWINQFLIVVGEKIWFILRINYSC